MGEEAAAKARAEAEEAARRKKEEADRIAATMVECKCGDKFLPHLLPQHQRSCEACHPPKPKPSPPEPSANDNEYGFVPCDWCGRTFFPDRLAVHKNVCKKRPPNGDGTGIRPTITTIDHLHAGGTVGEYSGDQGRRWRAFQMGAAIA